MPLYLILADFIHTILSLFDTSINGCNDIDSPTVMLAATSKRAAIIFITFAMESYPITHSLLKTFIIVV